MLCVMSAANSSHFLRENSNSNQKRSLKTSIRPAGPNSELRRRSWKEEGGGSPQSGRIRESQDVINPPAIQVREVMQSRDDKLQSLESQLNEVRPNWRRGDIFGDSLSEYVEIEYCICSIGVHLSERLTQLSYGGPFMLTARWHSLESHQPFKPPCLPCSCVARHSGTAERRESYQTKWIPGFSVAFWCLFALSSRGMKVRKQSSIHLYLPAGCSQQTIVDEQVHTSTFSQLRVTNPSPL